ncbi:MAG: hypothetical protein HeimC3_41940 [Candidatus Heimdallarchaeota archaeon LC_3]|nr:MAG: hypothetical protein HeimC3_41940 [Candidatus Heimdallarchaeota archaeon LC_3]
MKLFDIFDDNLKKALELVAPQLLIIHGKSLTEWTRNNIKIDLNRPEITFSRFNSPYLIWDEYKVIDKKNQVFSKEGKLDNEKYSLWTGTYNDKIPVVFIDRFINRLTDGDKCFKIFGDYIREKCNLKIVKENSNKKIL